MALISPYAELEQIDRRRRRQTINLKPIGYWDAGSLRRSVLDFVQGDASFPHVVTAAPMMLSVGADGMRRLHPTREPDRYLEIGAPFVKVGGTWQKVNLGQATRSGKTITWQTAQADVIVTMGGHFVKLAIPLKNGWQPPGGQFAFPVGISGLTRSGGTILRDGVPVALLRPPVVYDAARPLDVRPIASQFVTVSGQAYILFTLPSLAGMVAPVVDPTITLQPTAAGIDTWIQNVGSTNNMGADSTLGTGTTGSYTDRTLIKFDLSTVPENFNSATLSLFCYSDQYGDEPGGLATNNVYRQKRAWVEGTRTGQDDNPATGATWNRYDTSNNWETAGGFGANDCEQTEIGSVLVNALGWIDFALTPTTKTTLDLGNGWLVKAADEAPAGENMMLFNSSDAAENLPKLVVDYSTASLAFKLTIS